MLRAWKAGGKSHFASPGDDGMASYEGQGLGFMWILV